MSQRGWMNWGVGVLLMLNGCKKDAPAPTPQPPLKPPVMLDAGSVRAMVLDASAARRDVVEAKPVVDSGTATPQIALADASMTGDANVAGECPSDPHLAVVFEGPVSPEGPSASPLHGRYVNLLLVERDKDHDFDDAGDERRRAISADVARSLGADASDDPLWVFSDAATPPCKAKLGEFYLMRGDSGTGDFTHVVRAVSGCSEAFSKPGFNIALRDKADLSQCHYMPASAAGRDEHGATPPPAGIAGLYSGVACSGPNCELRWSVWSAVTPTAEAVSLTVSAVHKSAGDECSWKTDDINKTIVRTLPNGAPLELFRDDELLGLFYDSKGASAVVSDNVIGTITLYNVRKAAGGNVPNTSAHWHYGNEEDRGGHFSLGPYCGP